MKEIDENEENQNEPDFIFYHKVNIFGDNGVGKSTLISRMENYGKNDNKDNNDNKDSLINRNLSQLSVDSYTEFNSIVEQIKKVKLIFNNKENNNEPLYLNVYETDLDRYNTIKMNLDTLLFQTHCIIIMWDNSEIDTFRNIDELISVIVNGIKEKTIKETPIFLIRNKMDLEIRNSGGSFNNNASFNNNDNNINDSINKVKEKYNDYITYKEISLNKKDDNYKTFGELISDINNEILTNNNNNKCVKLHKNIIIEHSSSKKYDKVFKFILLGHTEVGKTTFYNNIQGKEADGLATVGIVGIRILAEICNEKLLIQLWDTAGQERYKSLAKSYWKAADGILLMFEVTNKESFKTVHDWYTSIKENNDKDPKIILIGNKIDQNEKRTISKVEAKNLASKYNINYYESCCLNGLNVFEILNELILTACNINEYYSNRRKSFHLEKKIENEYEVIDKDNLEINGENKIGNNNNDNSNNKNRGCC